MNIRKVKESDSDQLIDLLNDIGWFTELLSKSKELLKNKFINDINQCLLDDSHSFYVVEENDNYKIDTMNIFENVTIQVSYVSKEMSLRYAA